MTIECISFAKIKRFQSATFPTTTEASTLLPIVNSYIHQDSCIQNPRDRVGVWDHNESICIEIIFSPQDHRVVIQVEESPQLVELNEVH